MIADSTPLRTTFHPVSSEKLFSTVPNPINSLMEVRESRVHGMGLFAKVFIPKGTVWWHPEAKDVLLITREQYATFMNSAKNPLSTQMLNTINIYCYYAALLDSLVFCLDNARFVNHSETPNSGPHPSGHPLMAMTLRDIQPGEEIMEDYRAYDRCLWACLHGDFLCIP